ncbi:MAG: pilus assembly protein [Myxococcota bacterium]
MARMNRFAAHASALALAAALMLPSGASRADDAVLFTTTSVAPNVLLLLDSSASMNHLIWHPAFDPDAPVSCNSTHGLFPAVATGAFDPTATYFAEGNNFKYRVGGVGPLLDGDSTTRTTCGKLRTIPTDANASPDDTILGSNKKYTWYSGAYLNWLFSDEATPYYADISSAGNGIPTSCVGGSTFAKYGRTRMNVTKQVLKDVVCQVNLVGQVRFGIAQFRNRAPGGTSDTNGGFVIEELQVPSSNQQADLVSAINNVDSDTDAPLSEALFQLYTYYMSRDSADLPKGKDGVTAFPRYEFDTQSSQTGGNHNGSSNAWPPDPVEFSCQKNFIMLITDGDSTKDDFDVETDAPEAAGFADFASKLIGDYNTTDGGETEEQVDLAYVGSESSLYLDDIALYMTERDFRPDLNGDQTIDTYTIGFHASDGANALLSKTAAVGNGLFFAVTDEDALAQAIIDQLNSIIEKSQSFTAATVPASRTADGEQLYVSLFTPSSKTPYWDGHLRSYRLTGNGEIHDANGQCALDSVDCFSGQFLAVEDAPPFWDASDEMPAPFSRNLRVSVLRGGSLDPEPVSFLHEAPVAAIPPANAVAAADLGITALPSTVPLGSIAMDAEQYAAEVVASVRGCKFGTGANSVACTLREGQLPDIFHSNPVLVGTPVLFESDPSYKDGFKGLVGGRDRVIYAGSNGGFVHGFHAGDWDATDKKYDEGTGAEVMGFMPWTARQNIQHKPGDKGNREYYFVDGSPTVADVWFYTDYTVGDMDASGDEWRTVLVTGSRQGGEAYLGIDVTDPDAGTCASPAQGAGYPCYLWEFPREDDVAAHLDWVGQTWGEPIITKVAVKVGADVLERWVAVVTGGYDKTGDPNDHLSYIPDATKGRSIWVLDVKTGVPLASRKFDTNGDCANPAAAVNSTAERQMCFAIASTPAVYDTDGNGLADVIYVGDLGGNLWKWVIEAPLELSAATAAADADADWPFRKFFAAPVYNDGSNDFYKSFYFPPAGTRKNGKIWLAIGSGERNDLTYLSDPDTDDDNNRFYVLEEVDVFDQGSPVQPLITEDPDLTNLTNTNTCGSVAGKGYFIVGSEGEKWVTNVEIFVGYVIVSSYIPQPSADPCEIGGLAFLWAFRVECGQGYFAGSSGSTTRTQDIGAGLPTDPRVTVGPNGEGSNRVIVSKQGGDVVNIEAPPGFPGSGMFYWRELLE